MATNKKAISAYLPTDIEEYLTKYCTEYDITRKDKSGEIKPALGTAVVEILKIFFNSEDLPSPLPDNVPLLPSNVVTEDRLSEVLSELRTSSNAVNTLPSNVLTKDDLERQVEAAIGEAIPKAIANLKSDKEFIRAIALKARDSAVEVEPNEESTTRIDKASLSPIFDELENETTTTQKQLANTTSMSAKEEQSQTRIELGSTEEAYKLAQSRGFKGKLASFRSNIGREKYAQQYREDYGIIRVGQRNESQYFNVWREN